MSPTSKYQPLLPVSCWRRTDTEMEGIANTKFITNKANPINTVNVPVREAGVTVSPPSLAKENISGRLTITRAVKLMMKFNR